MSDGTNKPIDAEALQAQIDLSLSLTFDLVASWMTPASASGSGSATRNGVNAASDDADEIELEHYLHRPPT